MGRIVTTVAPLKGGERKILFSNVMISNIYKHPNGKGWIVEAQQKETPFYPPLSNSTDSFFQTGLDLSTLGMELHEELRGWRPFESRIRTGRTFVTNLTVTEGEVLPDRFHIQKVRSNTPQRTGHRPNTKTDGTPILIDGKSVYTSYRFLSNFEGDLFNDKLEFDSYVLNEGNVVVENEIDW